VYKQIIILNSAHPNKETKTALFKFYNDIVFTDDLNKKKQHGDSKESSGDNDSGIEDGLIAATERLTVNDDDNSADVSAESTPDELLLYNHVAYTLS
jgi:hypothetical protein